MLTSQVIAVLAAVHCIEGRLASRATQPLRTVQHGVQEVGPSVDTTERETGTAAAQPDGAMLWVYNCGDNQTEWSQLVDYLNITAKPAGVTSVSICAYRIETDGSFGYQTAPYGPTNCGQNQEAQAALIRSTGLRQYPLIDCHAGMDAVRLMLATNESRGKFISAALATMKAHGYDGFNLDIELSGTPADAALYTTFVDEFASALHGAGGALSSDVGSCGMGHRDYIGMRCAEDYRTSEIDGVMTMGTYTHDLSSFKGGVAAGLAGLGLSKYVVGVDTGSDGPSYFEYLTSVNVTRVALWACGQAGCLQPEFLAAMAKWRATLISEDL